MSFDSWLVDSEGSANSPFPDASIFAAENSLAMPSDGQLLYNKFKNRQQAQSVQTMKSDESQKVASAQSPVYISPYADELVYWSPSLARAYVAKVSAQKQAAGSGPKWTAAEDTVLTNEVARQRNMEKNSKRGANKGMRFWAKVAKVFANRPLKRSAESCSGRWNRLQTAKPKNMRFWPPAKKQALLDDVAKMLKASGKRAVSKPERCVLATKFNSTEEAIRKRLIDLRKNCIFPYPDPDEDSDATELVPLTDDEAAEDDDDDVGGSGGEVGHDELSPIEYPAQTEMDFEEGTNGNHAHSVAADTFAAQDLRMGSANGNHGSQASPFATDTFASEELGMGFDDDVDGNQAYPFATDTFASQELVMGLQNDDVGYQEYPFAADTFATQPLGLDFDDIIPLRNWDDVIEMDNSGLFDDDLFGDGGALDGRFQQGSQPDDFVGADDTMHNASQLDFPTCFQSDVEHSPA